MEITKNEFGAFKDVQESGLTNMFDLTNVSNMSGLSKEKIIVIMKKYNFLKDLYGVKK